MNRKNKEINAITKESISESATDILKRNMQLSVSTICKHAGVSRNAYYRNFESIDDVFIYYIAMKWAEYAKINRVEDVEKDKISEHLIRFFYLQKDFVLSLKAHNMIYLIEKLFVSVIVPPQAESALRYALYGTSYFIYGLIRAMIDNDFSDSPEEIIKMFK
ncbi:TetR/AcrR family transcriptional regulator [Thomasclavelia spiroformis]|uniref:TetR/AcrR family transcriptional regulator n=1 Tax=Thomasclavelia spiroformis TaxID=29348 RepID=UPI0039A1E656